MKKVPVSIVLAFLGVSFCSPSRAADEWYSFTFHSRKARQATGIIMKEDPEASAGIFSSNLGIGDRVMGHCRSEKVPKVRAALEKALGDEFKDWENNTPHDWESQEGWILAGSPDRAKRVLNADALSELSSDRTAAIANDLRYMLENHWSYASGFKDGILHQAVRALGYLKDAKAVTLLRSHLTFIPVHGTTTAPGLPDVVSFPCAVALARIGAPASQEMVSVITASKDLNERNLAAWVLFHAKGGDLSAVSQELDALRKEKPDTLNAVNEANRYLAEFKAKWGDKALTLEEP